MSRDSGFTIVSGEKPAVKVPGEVCKHVCSLIEVQHWLRSHRDNGLSTKIVEIIKREMKVDDELTQSHVDEYAKLHVTKEDRLRLNHW